MIDLFQADNSDSKACDKVVQSYKKTVKISFKICPKPEKRQLLDKQNTEKQNTKYAY